MFQRMTRSRIRVFRVMLHARERRTPAKFREMRVFQAGRTSLFRPYSRNCNTATPARLSVAAAFAEASIDAVVIFARMSVAQF